MRPEETKLVAGLSLALADSYGQCGNISQAMDYTCRAATLLRPVDPLAFAQCLQRLSSFQGEIGQDRRALYFAHRYYRVISLQAGHDQDGPVKSSYAVSLGILGIRYFKLRNFTSSKCYLERALLLLQDVTLAFPQEPYFLHQTAIVYQYLSYHHKETGQIDAAFSHAEEFFWIAEELRAKFPENFTYLEMVADGFKTLGDLFMKRQLPQDAMELYVKCDEILLQLCALLPQSVTYKNMAAELRIAIADYHLTVSKDYGFALSHYKRAATQYRELVLLCPDQLLIAEHDAICSQQSGRCYEAQNRHETALEHFGLFLSKMEKLCARSPKNVHFHESLGCAHQYLGLTYRELGFPDKAIVHSTAMWEIFNTLYQQSPDDIAIRQQLANAHQHLGRLYWLAKDHGQAEKHLLEMDRHYRDIFQLDPSDENYKRNHGLAMTWVYQFYEQRYNESSLLYQGKKWLNRRFGRSRF